MRGAVKPPCIPCVRRLQEMQSVFHDSAFAVLLSSAAFGGVKETLCA